MVLRVLTAAEATPADLLTINRRHGGLKTGYITGVI